MCVCVTIVEHRVHDCQSIIKNRRSLVHTPKARVSRGQAVEFEQQIPQSVLKNCMDASDFTFLEILSRLEEASSTGPCNASKFGNVCVAPMLHLLVAPVLFWPVHVHRYKRSMGNRWHPTSKP